MCDWILPSQIVFNLLYVYDKIFSCFSAKGVQKASFELLPWFIRSTKVSNAYFSIAHSNFTMIKLPKGSIAYLC